MPDETRIVSRQRPDGSLMQPEANWMPLANVEVAAPVMLSAVASTPCRLVDVPATELVRLPEVVSVMPLVEVTPDDPTSTVPFEKLLVVAFVCRILPPVMVRPFEVESPAVETPPANVEVAVVVAMIEGKTAVPYAVRPPAMVVLPCTESAVPGVEVPMPNSEFAVSTVRKLAESSVVTEE